MNSLNSVLAGLMPQPSVAGPELNCSACTKVAKCCDFQPFLANFLIGALLDRNSAFELSGDHYWQPLGLIPNSKFRQRHAELGSELRGSELQCNFFDISTRKCGIWELRPGECSTYFCEGAGVQHRNLSVQAFALETGLAQRALYEFGFSQNFVSAQVDVLNNAVEPVAVPESELHEIYRFCWSWARNLRGEDVRRWL